MPVRGLSLELVDFVENLSDEAQEGIAELVTHTIGDQTFVYATDVAHDLIRVFSLNEAGQLTHLTDIPDTDGAALEGARAPQIFSIGDRDFLALTAVAESGISVFEISEGPPYATLVQSVFDFEDPAYSLGQPTFLEIGVYGNTAYFYSGFVTEGTLEAAESGGLNVHAFSIGSSEEVLFEHVQSLDDPRFLGSLDAEIIDNRLIVPSIGPDEQGLLYSQIDPDTGEITASDFFASSAMENFVHGLSHIRVDYQIPDYSGFLDNPFGPSAPQYSYFDYFYVTDALGGMTVISYDPLLDLWSDMGASEVVPGYSTDLLSDLDQPLFAVSGGSVFEIYEADLGRSFSTGALERVVTGSTGTDADYWIEGIANANWVEVGSSLFLLQSGSGETAITVHELSAGDDVIQGTSGDDWLIGGRGDDIFYGGRGRDIFDGGAGADQFFGGSLGAFVDYRGSDAAVTVNLTTGTAQGGDAEGDSFSEINGIIGTRFGDVLTDGRFTALYNTTPSTFDSVGEDLAIEQGVFGEAGADMLYAHWSGSNLFGGIGNDTLVGGIGYDMLAGGTGNDFMDGGPDRITGSTFANAVSYEDINGGVTVRLGITSAQDTGAGGIDTILNVGDLIGGRGFDHLYGDDGSNGIWGLDGSDRLYGLTGDDWLYGDQGHDLLVGGAGDDSLYGGTGADRLFGGAEDDTLHGEAGGDLLHGGDGTDNLFGDAGGDVLIGGAGQDALFGGEGNDTLRGGAGVDYIEGGLGADILAGGAFVDGGFVMDGVQDVFIWNSEDESGAGGRDIVRDFEQGVDLLDVSAIMEDNQNLWPVGELAIQQSSSFATVYEAALSYSFENGNTILSIGLAEDGWREDFYGNDLRPFEIELVGEIHLTLDDFIL